MANLKLEASELVEGLPIKIGGLELSLVQNDAITAIMPAKGQLAAVKNALGGWPETGQSAECNFGRLVWSGLDQAFLFGRAEIARAACVDISDGWVFFALKGDAADAALARLVPVDLRRSKTSIGQSFRTMLGHLQVMVVVAENGFEIGVMSSFAETAKHELIEVMETVEAISEPAPNAD